MLPRGVDACKTNKVELPCVSGRSSIMTATDTSCRLVAAVPDADYDAERASVDCRSNIVARVWRTTRRSGWISSPPVRCTSFLPFGRTIMIFAAGLSSGRTSRITTGCIILITCSVQQQQQPDREVVLTAADEKRPSRQPGRAHFAYLNICHHWYRRKNTHSLNNRCLPRIP